MFHSKVLTKSELFGDAFCFREGHNNRSAWPDFQKTSTLYIEFILAYSENIKTEAVPI